MIRTVAPLLVADLSVVKLSFLLEVSSLILYR